MAKIKNAAFVQRLGAMLIDIMLIMLISSILTTFTINVDNYQKLTEESNNVMEEYLNEKIDAKTYISKSTDISYDISRETVLSTIITLAIYILYFIVFQFHQNGQTIGKKLMKIRIISNNSEELTMNQIAIRALLVNCILADLMILTVTVIGTKDMFFISSMIVESIQYLLMLVIVFMVLFRKDKRGFHDIITNTKVIKEV